MKSSSIFLLLLLFLLFDAFPVSSAACIKHKHTGACHRSHGHHHHHRHQQHRGKEYDYTMREMVCEVCSSSPLSKDVIEATDMLMKAGNRVLQLNEMGSKCTTVVTHNSASIGVCGGRDWMDHKRLANFAWRLNEKCQEWFDGVDGPRVGGKVVFDWGRIIVF